MDVYVEKVATVDGVELSRLVCRLICSAYYGAGTLHDMAVGADCDEDVARTTIRRANRSTRLPVFRKRNGRIAGLTNYGFEVARRMLDMKPPVFHYYVTDEMDGELKPRKV